MATASALFALLLVAIAPDTVLFCGTSLYVHFFWRTLLNAAPASVYQ